MEKYPHAKVILTTRDSEKWHQSCMETIYLHSTAKTGIFARLILYLRSRFMLSMLDAVIWHGTFHSRFEEKDYAIKIDEEHIEEVKRVVPKEKLLVFSVTDGWTPLCQFLGVDVCYFTF